MADQLQQLEEALALYEEGEASAHDALVELAGQELPEATLCLGHCYRDGQGCSPNLDKAVELYLQTWMAGNEEGYSALTELQPRLAMAAEEGSAWAQHALGVLARVGEEDPEKGLFWMQKAAEQEHPEALRMVGECYYRGDGVEQDTATALRFYQRAADLGERKAQYNLGRAFAEGMGDCEVDIDRAIHWYRQACENGFTIANIPLCKLLASRNRDLNDAKETIQRLRDLAANCDSHKTWSISSDDGEWSIVVSNRGESVGVDGIDISQLDLTPDIGWQ